MRKLIRALVLLFAASCGTGPTYCVARGAKVRVPGGETPIEDLEVGDEVMCADPATGELIATTLTRIVKSKRECVSLVMGAGSTTLTCTSDHPVYCPDTGQWAPAGDWVTGKRSKLMVLEGTSGRLVSTALGRSEIYAGLHEVFDLTVEHAHHNFVANGVLVHNKQPACDCTCADGTKRQGTCSFEPDAGTDCQSRGISC